LNAVKGSERIVI